MLSRRHFLYSNALALVGAMSRFRLNAYGMEEYSGLASHWLPDEFGDARKYRPYTLWQWINGCVTKEGITYDLEAFKKAGIDNVQQFLVGGSEADITDPEVTVLGEKWMELMRFALDECRRLGMTFGTHNCPGWSASGAPGILTEDSMQQLVWTKTVVRSDESLTAIIPRAEPLQPWNFYRDICVIAVPAGSNMVAKTAIRILAGGLTANDTLQERLPPGEWLVLRFGHTITGHRNLTAPASGQGLEVDKMSKEALEKFWALYPAKLVAMAGDHAGKTFRRFELDSFEAGEQTWTKKMVEEFETRRGYALLPWLPSLAGLVVESEELTARFKDDWQRTITSLFAENYYGHLATLINRAGMEFLLEPYGTGKVNFDIGAIRGIGDMVMCEFWYGPTTWGWDSIMPVASNAHVNGKRIVAAESFTGQPQFAWKVDLFDLKQAGDRAFCNGVNLFVLHASAHQPWPHAKPGMTMGWWGTQFGPSQTWWTHGAPEWIEYVSRCQMLLQKGLFVADICFLHLSRQRDPVVPAGYKADICNAAEFVQRFDVVGNEWGLPDGMRYKLVVLPPNSSIDLELAQRIEQMVRKGGVVIGNGFKGSVGLQGLPADAEVKRISDALFGIPSSGNTFDKRVRDVGQGKVYTGYDVDEVMQRQGIAKDVTVQEGEKDLLWIHRKDKAEHFYFVSNQSNASRDVRLSFRVAGLQPELANAETGVIIDAPVWEQTGDNTTVQMRFEPYGSAFVVFRKAASARHGITALHVDGKAVNPFDYLLTDGDGSRLRLRAPGAYVLHSSRNQQLKTTRRETPVVTTLSSDWSVSFERDKGAPPRAHFDKLVSFTEHDAKGIRYFSGKATYRKDFTLPASALSRSKAVFLELGAVRNVATIIVNGRKVRTFWKPPFAAEITSWCRPGKNVLEVEVTNLWPNRLIGDEAEPDDLVWGKDRYFGPVTPRGKIGRNLQVVPDWVKDDSERPSRNRVAFTTMDFFDKEDALLPSGLLGPVQLSVEGVWTVNL